MFFGHIFQKAKTTKKGFICLTRITQGKPAGSTDNAKGLFNINNFQPPLKQQQENLEETADPINRKRIYSTGSSWIMHSYNRHIRNQSIIPKPVVSLLFFINFNMKHFQRKQSPPSQLNIFELVSINNCRLSNRTIPNYRNELCECWLQIILFSMIKNVKIFRLSNCTKWPSDICGCRLW
jgi:hypothetical protein